jgi:hypothetical protein
VKEIEEKKDLHFKGVHIKSANEGERDPKDVVL